MRHLRRTGQARRRDLARTIYYLWRYKLGLLDIERAVAVSLGWIRGRDEAADPAERDRHRPRSEEHTSELQSRFDLVCRLLLEKKKKKYKRDASVGRRSANFVHGAPCSSRHTHLNIG